MVESQPSKLLVASSILVSRSMFSTTCKTINSTPLLRLLHFRFFAAFGCRFPETANSKSSFGFASMTADSSFVTASIF